MNLIIEKVIYIKSLCSQSDENNEGNMVDWFEYSKFDNLLNLLEQNPEITKNEIDSYYYQL